jgi:hypothetical protein
MSSTSQNNQANGKWQKMCVFLDVQMEVKITFIRDFRVQQGRYGDQLCVERVPVWIVCLELEIMSFNQAFGTQSIPPVFRTPYRGDWVKARTLWEDSISRSRQSIHTGAASTCTWCPYLPSCTWKTLIQVFLTSKRTSAHSESPTPFLGFWVPTKTSLLVPRLLSY